MADSDQPTSDPWLTLPEIAKELRVNPATVRLWVSRGRLNATRAGARKLLVRRSELDRMLAADSAPADPTGSPAENAAATAPENPVRTRAVSPAMTERDLGPMDHDAIHAALTDMRVADEHWTASLDASIYAPPDPGFASRVRRIGEAAALESSAIRRAAAINRVVWNPMPSGRQRRLSYELRPGGNRPGPAEPWQRFDATVERVWNAVEGTDMYAVADRYGELADLMHEIADELDADAELQARPQAG